MRKCGDLTIISVRDSPAQEICTVVGRRKGAALLASSSEHFLTSQKSRGPHSQRALHGGEVEEESLYLSYIP